MKTGNVILAIFLWLCIPASIFFGFFGAVAGGGGELCILSPFILFILGLIALITGRETNRKEHHYYHETSVIDYEKSKNNLKSSDTKYCMHCGKQINQSAKFCPECGKSLVSEHD